MHEPPKGPIKWLRRRVLPWAARLTALAGVALLGAWLTGRILTDQHHWAQYVWWMPAEWVLAGAWGLWVVSAVIGRLSTRLGGAFVRPFLLVGALLATVWVFFVGWRVHRYVAPVRAHGETIRIAHWNLSANELGGDPTPFIAGREPDLVVVTNARYDRDRPGLVAGLRGLGGGEHAGYLERGRLMVAGTLPVVGYGAAELDRLAGVPDDWPSAHDPGQVAYLEVDVSSVFPELGRPMVLWVVDVPSHPSLWRMDVMHAAGFAVESWSGPAFRVGDSGRLTPVEAEGPFPEPDVVVGDFNAPRGSASVRTLVGGMREAHAAAGRGRDATFRFRLRFFSPGLQIDQSFVGDGWRAAGYDVARRPPVKHAMQWVDVEPRR